MSKYEVFKNIFGSIALISTFISLAGTLNMCSIQREGQNPATSEGVIVIDRKSVV